MAGERRDSVPPGGGERRSATRVPVDVWVEESRERETYFQRGANLSVGGIFLDRSIPHPLGTVMALKFTLPGESAPIQVRGTIVNVALGESDGTGSPDGGGVGGGPGMGVAFTDMDDDTRARIARFVAAHAEG